MLLVTLSGIVLIDNVLSASTCKALVDAAKFKLDVESSDSFDEPSDSSFSNSRFRGG